MIGRASSRQRRHSRYARRAGRGVDQRQALLYREERPLQLWVALLLDGHLATAESVQLSAVGPGRRAVAALFFGGHPQAVKDAERAVQALGASQ